MPILRHTHAGKGRNRGGAVLLLVRPLRVPGSGAHLGQGERVQAIQSPALRLGSGDDAQLTTQPAHREGGLAQAQEGQGAPCQMVLRIQVRKKGMSHSFRLHARGVPRGPHSPIRLQWCGSPCKRC
jgi:hypothetical protein